jgi:hypothetical protein
MFSEVYPHAIHFHGEHRMDDHSFMHSVVPVIRWIDDQQEGRERPIIYIGIESMVNAHQQPAPSVQKAVRMLIEHYQVYFVSPTENRWAQWLEDNINVPAWHHMVCTYRRDLLYGDFLIERKKADGEKKEFIIEAQIRMSGKNYILVSEETEEEEAEAMILVDTSSPEEAEAVYEPVMDDELLDTLMPLFEEELEDAEIRN